MQVLKQKLKSIKILREDREQKSLVLSGEDDTGNTAILIFNRKAFPITDIALNQLTNPDIVLEQTTDHVNDIWHTYQVMINDEIINQTKLTIVYPATEKLIKKYTATKSILVEETGKMYLEITKPYLDRNQNSLQWIYNVLDGKSEQDRVVYHNKDEKDGFILVPSMNWPGEIEDLYLITLPNRKDLGSVRDLRGEHVEFLEKMEKETVGACEEKYGLGKGQLRIFFHYQPSFYHLHLHVMNVGYRPTGTEVGRAVLLRDVIDNLKMDSEYYVKKTMSYCLKEDDELLKLLNE